MNALEMIIDFFKQLLTGIDVIKTFLFSVVTVPVINVEVSVWMLFGGVGLLAALIAALVKCFI